MLLFLLTVSEFWETYDSNFRCHLYYSLFRVTMTVSKIECFLKFKILFFLTICNLSAISPLVASMISLMDIWVKLCCDFSFKRYWASESFLSKLLWEVVVSSLRTSSVSGLSVSSSSLSTELLPIWLCFLWQWT